MASSVICALASAATLAPPPARPNLLSIRPYRLPPGRHGAFAGIPPALFTAMLTRQPRTLQKPQRTRPLPFGTQPMRLSPRRLRAGSDDLGTALDVPEQTGRPQCAF